MEQERKRIRVPVEVDDDGFSIDEERLDESLHRRIDRLAEEKVSKRRAGLRASVAGFLGLIVLGMITILAMRGAFLFAIILLMIGVFNVKDIVGWIEGKE